MQTSRARAASHAAPRVIRRREVGGLMLSECAYPPGLRMPKHDHEPAYFSLVLSGAYTETIGSTQLAGNPSSLVAHPPERAHAVAFHEREVRIFRAEVRPRWLELRREYSVNIETPACFEGGAAVGHALRLYMEFRAADNYTPLAVEGIMLEMLAEISRRAEPAEGRRAPRWLERAREILHEQACVIPTLASLAASVGVHPVHLAHEFRKFYRESVGEYARRLRVEAACREVAQSERPLSEIAADAGFYDQSHFSNAFKRHTGLTPAAFRSAARSN
ncbi:MAG: helix-turn-helix transcriptional regulator [Acidobacteria bacterium]|nr:helix-turn-helix transcriptional regulator [Acidobacteriota bacterium]